MADLPRYVVWRVDLRNGKPTKMPYNPATGRQAKSDDPLTWTTRNIAEAAAGGIIGTRVGGIGIMLGDLGGGIGIGGMDLDTCRAADGNFEPWAKRCMDAMATYSEISPSGTGVKLLFLYRTDDLPALRSAMGDAKWGKQWKRGGGEHPPAIELYLGHRFFAITEDLAPGAQVQIATVPAAALFRLIQVNGPAFAGKQQQSGGKGAKSRSEAAFRVGARAKRSGATYEEMVEAIRADPDSAEWFEEKGKRAGARELKRIWEKVSAEGVDDVLAEFNKKYMVVNEAGKTMIYAPSYDPLLKRIRLDRMSFGDLSKLYMNRRIEIGVNGKENPIIRTAAEVWLDHSQRRQYLDGVVFDPSGRHAGKGVYNLWQGFVVQPSPGDWSLLRQHIAGVICGHDRVRFEYLMGWMARMLQFPAEQGEVAIVLRGGEGTGKGTLAKALMRLVGQHGIAISNAKHLVGAFNGHLRDAIFLFADEAFYAGDKQHVGTLKSIITEPYLTIEAKFQNAIQTPNMLHIMMASNEEWVIPASVDARRFLVLEVVDTVVGDHDYFGKIWEQMDNGGYEAMLHDLLAMDISGFNVRAVPVTEGLQRQRKQSLPVPETWWQDCLARGYVFDSKLGLAADLGVWLPEVSTELLFRSYSGFAADRRERHPMSREMLGTFMVRFGCKAKRLSDAVVGEQLTDVSDGLGRTHRKAVVIRQARPQGYSLGELDEARDGFCRVTGLAVEWGVEDEG